MQVLQKDGNLVPKNKKITSRMLLSHTGTYVNATAVFFFFFSLSKTKRGQLVLLYFFSMNNFGTSLTPSDSIGSPATSRIFCFSQEKAGSMESTLTSLVLLLSVQPDSL